MHRAASACLAAAFAMTTAMAQDSASPDSRPKVVTKQQFDCLVRHARALEVSASGTVVDISECPPRLRLGFFPRRLEDRFMILTPEDLKCLEKARKPGHGIAFRRSGDKVALYLRPCGR